MKAFNPLPSAFSAEIWNQVSAQLLSKMIAEFMYEEIIHPQVMEEDSEANTYELRLSQGVTYTYRAKPRLFDSYRVFTETIQRHTSDSSTTATNPIRFLLDLQETVNISSTTLSHLLHEYNRTLIADAHLLVQKQKQQTDLTTLDYVELENEMEGHPCITYNKGRIGFSYSDYLAYAPEQKKAVQLLWLAVHKSRATYHTVEKAHQELILEEIGQQQYNHFSQQLHEQGKSAEDYFFLPVHEWQWDHYIVSFFAEDLAQQKIIPLGYGEDQYRPQQSIRTFVNVSHRQKHHVKLPMSILNTLVYRGLPGERTVLAPKITSYIQNIWRNDPFLHKENALILPGEIASVNVDHAYYPAIQDAPYQYMEMLGCIWRESIYSFLQPDESAITLASLLHTDGRGKPYVQSLIEKSGLSVEEWLKRLFSVILPPLLHYLYQYGVVFSPHGQNTILVLKDFAPHRLAIKDFVDDVNVSQHPLPELEDLPEDLRTVLRSEPPEGLCQFIFTGLFVCHFRYLSDLLDHSDLYPEEAFWQAVRETILQYQQRFPQNQERYEVFDLLKPTFTKLCLNRNRLLDYGYTDDDDRPHASEYGQVNNPLAHT
jgi:siderophore synthetase component